MQLTKHFKFSEFVYSKVADREGIRNVPDHLQYRNLLELAHELERVREVCSAEALIITSGFRSQALNRAVGGVKGSAHCEGHAVDFYCVGELTVHECYRIIKSTIFNYDQLILYPDFIHISFAPWKRLQSWIAY